MSVALRKFWADDRRRQQAIVTLLLAVFLIGGTAPRNERALFLVQPSGIPGAFGAQPAASPFTLAVLDPGVFPRRRAATTAPRFAAIGRPASQLLSPTSPAGPNGAISPLAPGASTAPVSGTLGDGPIGTPNDFAFGSPFNPASPGGFFSDGNAPPGGGQGLDPDPGVILPPQIPALPEPATWLTMLIGFLVIGSTLRRANTPLVAA